MASEVSIANRALLMLGARPITSFSDTSEEARIANATYADIRDEMLRGHPWNFAIKRASLAASATAPEWDMDNAFLIPTDCLRVLEVNADVDQEWKLERTADGRVIVTDLDAPLEIRYIARVTEPELFCEGFRRALAEQCAAVWAERVTGSTDRAAKMAVQAKQTLAQAKNEDGQEQSQDIYSAEEWINARV